MNETYSKKMIENDLINSITKYEKMSDFNNTKSFLNIYGKQQ